MDENQLAKNIMYYRKKRGLSQEKLSEYMGVSRQAVTKWEKALSRPSSENLIKLAKILHVSVDVLLDHEEQENLSTELKIVMGKTPWIFIGISCLCIFVYIISSVLLKNFNIGTLICMFVICVPIQLFLHIYFSNAIHNDSFIGIAGFDDKIQYNICEVKKLLVQINLHIGITSTMYIFLLCVLNCIDLKVEWMNGFLIVVYALHFVMTVEASNYKMIDKIYCLENDKKRAKRGVPITVLYTLLLFVGIATVGILFEMKGIENNTIPAMKICGWLLLGAMTATIGAVLEYNQIKKWNPENTGYKINKISILCFFICVILYGFMCIV